MTTQPEALRLADALGKYRTPPEAAQAAAELRRLHEANQELLAALNAMLTYTADLNPAQGFDDDDHGAVKQACAASNKAERTTP
jgi:hypothetical protein